MEGRKHGVGERGLIANFLERRVNITRDEGWKSEKGPYLIRLLISLTTCVAVLSSYQVVASGWCFR